MGQNFASKDGDAKRETTFNHHRSPMKVV